MRAVARQREKFTHDLKVRQHRLTADEPEDSGGDDMGPSPQELLAAVAGLLHGDHDRDVRASARAGTSTASRSTVDYTPAERGCATNFKLVMRMPAHLSEDQVERLRVIAAKCPVHRTLEGEVLFDERVELA